MNTKEKILEEISVLEQKGNQHEIVLYNDDVNTFDLLLTHSSKFVNTPLSKPSNVPI